MHELQVLVAVSSLVSLASTNVVLDSLYGISAAVTVMLSAPKRSSKSKDTATGRITAIWRRQLILSQYKCSLRSGSIPLASLELLARCVASPLRRERSESQRRSIDVQLALSRHDAPSALQSPLP